MPAPVGAKFGLIILDRTKAWRGRTLEKRLSATGAIVRHYCQARACGGWATPGFSAKRMGVLTLIEVDAG